VIDLIELYQRRWAGRQRLPRERIAGYERSWRPSARLPSVDRFCGTPRVLTWQREPVNVLAVLQSRSSLAGRVRFLCGRGRRSARRGETVMTSVDGLGAQRAQAMSTQMTTTQGVQGGHRRHHHDGAALQNAAKALGMDVKQVVSALQGGKSLDDLAQKQGVSHDDLVAAIKAGLPQRLQQSDRADQIAESIATRTGPPPRAQAADDDATSAQAVTGVLGSSLNVTQKATLDGLSSLLGTTSQDLLSSLQSGTSLADLVDAKGVDRGSLALRAAGRPARRHHGIARGSSQGRRSTRSTTDSPRRSPQCGGPALPARRRGFYLGTRVSDGTASMFSAPSTTSPSTAKRSARPKCNATAPASRSAPSGPRLARRRRRARARSLLQKLHASANERTPTYWL